MRTHIVLRTVGFTALVAILAAPGHMLAQAPTKTAVINEVKKKIPSTISDAFLDLRRVKGATACQAELDKAIVAATAEKQACLNPDTPPAGSPLDLVNKMNLAQFGQYCGDLSVLACANKVSADQGRFCARDTAIEMAKAKSVAARCEAGLKVCQNARANVTEAEANIARLEKELALARVNLPIILGRVADRCK